MRGRPDYVLGGNYESIVDEDGIYKVVMKLVVHLQKPSNFGIYKCIAKNALGSSEEIIKILREYYDYQSDEYLTHLMDSL